MQSTRGEFDKAVSSREAFQCAIGARPGRRGYREGCILLGMKNRHGVQPFSGK